MNSTSKIKTCLNLTSSSVLIEDYNLCSFDDDFGIWQQDDEDTPVWTRNEGRTERATSEGPNIHDGGNGMLAVIRKDTS